MECLLVQCLSFVNKTFWIHPECIYCYQEKEIHISEYFNIMANFFAFLVLLCTVASFIKKNSSFLTETKWEAILFCLEVNSIGYSKTEKPTNHIKIVSSVNFAHQKWNSWPAWGVMSSFYSASDSTLLLLQ